MRTEDGYIVRRCLDGEKAAFCFLVDKYREAVYALIYSKIHNFHDAEDITQEVFIKAYRKLHTLRRWDNFMAWLHSIALNQCRNWIRRHSKRPDSEFIEDQGPQRLIRHSMNAYHDDLISIKISEILDSLPDIHQQVLTLYYLGGMTVGDMAVFLGQSQRTIARKLNKARELLKEESINTLNMSFGSQKLPAGFTLRILELVKRIRIHPISQTPATPWGISAATTIALMFFAFSFSHPIEYQAGASNSVLSLEQRLGNMGENSLEISEAIEVFLIPSGLLDRNGRGPDTGSPSKEINAIVIGNMMAGKIKWRKHEANPVFKSGENEIWDKEIGSPSVLYDGGEYKMWYKGVDGINGSIGYATSEDGITWAKYPGNPVFTASESGWDSLYVSHPEVMIINGKYMMWYAGCDDSPLWRIGCATSDDGSKWVKHPNNPVLDLGKDGEWDSVNARAANVLFNNDKYKMWYAGASGRQRQHRIGYATSHDGITWVKRYNAPVLDLGPIGSWDGDEIGSPEILYDNGQYRMWYYGFDGSVSCIGHAIGMMDGVGSDEKLNQRQFWSKSNS